MLRQHAALLKKKLETIEQWPPPSELSILQDIYLYSAFRDADEGILQQAHKDWEDGRAYMVDPLAGRIAEAKADLIYGEEPEFRAGNKADQVNLENIVSNNNLPEELHWGVQLSVSEGETWWRGVIDKLAQDVPIIEFHSRFNVYPLYRNRQLLAVAFISVIEDGHDAWRYVEIHAEGVVWNLLYRVQAPSTHADTVTSYIPPNNMVGRPFGTEVALTERPETADLDGEWAHDLGIMLAGRIRNKRGRRARLGQSDYTGVKHFLFELNEAAAIGKENMRLTAKKRAVVPLDSLTVPTGLDLNASVTPPHFSKGEEIFIADSRDEELGSDKVGPFKILEYNFDAAELIRWTDALEDRILIRTRTAPQLVGKHTEGAQTGPALRARLLDSVLDSQGKGRAWDAGGPTATIMLQLLDALPANRGGFGRKYEDARARPVITRHSVLPEDEDARSLRLATEVGAGLLSRRTAIEDNHPVWDQERVEEELRRISGDELDPSEPPDNGGEQ